MRPSPLIVLLAVTAACGGSESTPIDTEYAMAEAFPEIAEIQAEEWEALSSRRIFFGHRSVGRNIMDGVRRVAERIPALDLPVVTSETPQTVEGPALVESDLGQNRHPETKDQAFAEVLESGFGDEPGAVAMYKYCYVDMQPETDPEQLFRDYARNIDRVRERHPSLTIVHMTMPLHEAGGGWIERLKTRLGQPTQIALNLKRNAFNELLRERYGGQEPIFDLALIESTRADGTRAYTRYRSEEVYMLAPEFTYDGGHLTEEAQDRVAEQLLVFLARLDTGAGDRSRMHADAGSAE